MPRAGLIVESGETVSASDTQFSTFDIEGSVKGMPQAHAQASALLKHGYLFRRARQGIGWLSGQP
jgi:hypothetical protein